MDTKEIAGRADLEAAKRYWELAARNPSLSHDYFKRAIEAERIGKAKLKEARRAR